MEFEEVITKRESVRKFSEKKLEKDKLDKILWAAGVAPTAKNLQPFKIYVVNSDEGITKIDKATHGRFGAQTILIVCGDMEKAHTKYGDSTYEIDATIAAIHMMLEATNLGVDNIFIKLFREEILKEEFLIPSNLKPIGLIPLGYRADDCPKSIFHDTRKDISELVEYR